MRCALVGRVIVGLALAALAPPASAFGAAWTIQSTPNSPNPANYLSAVSCTSATACMAVGTDNRNQGERPAGLVERWNGRRWAIVSTPKTAGFLTGVSCVSARVCFAVGYGSRGPVAERWNGRSWASQATTPVARGSELDGVSCVSATWCVAVGSSGPALNAPLAEVWNGTSWAVQPTPNPANNPADESARLSSVSCVSTVSCTAVGTDFTSGHQLILAEGWNGTSWKIEPTPNVRGLGNVTGVSCTSASVCTAVGWAVGALVERWNGSTWATQPTPRVAGSGLYAVSCVSATACTAVGTLDHGPSTQVPFAEGWNGTRWTAEHALNPAGGSGGLGLVGVSCVAPAECAAVGSGGFLVMGVGLTTLAESERGT
jgi:hypothetical protein